MDELDELLFEKYGIELTLTTRQKEIFIKNVLSAHWKSIHTTTFVNKNELYWSRYNEKNKGELLFGFLVNKENRAIRIKFKKEYDKRKKELEGDNDSSDS